MSLSLSAELAGAQLPFQLPGCVNLHNPRTPRPTRNDHNPTSQAVTLPLMQAAICRFQTLSGLGTLPAAPFLGVLTLLCSSSASANSFRMLASDSPTYLLRISGPLTTLGSLALSIFPICRAISVFPQPGGPYRRMPLTCLQPARTGKG